MAVIWRIRGVLVIDLDLCTVSSTYNPSVRVCYCTKQVSRRADEPGRILKPSTPQTDMTNFSSCHWYRTSFFPLPRNCSFKIEKTYTYLIYIYLRCKLHIVSLERQTAINACMRMSSRFLPTLTALLWNLHAPMENWHVTFTMNSQTLAY